MPRQLEAIQIQCSDRIKNALTSEAFRVDIRNEAGSDEAELLIYSLVGDDPGDEHSVGAAGAEKFLRANRNRPIHVRFNTPGGLAGDGITIHNALLLHNAPVRGTIEGMCASAGTIIAAGCESLRMFANARYMIHRAWTVGVGNTDDMLEYAEILNQVDRQIARTLAARAGASEDHIHELMRGSVDGTYMLAEDAMREGLVDEVIPLTRPARNEATVDPQATIAKAREQEIAARRRAADRQMAQRAADETLAAM